MGACPQTPLEGKALWALLTGTLGVGIGTVQVPPRAAVKTVGMLHPPLCPGVRGAVVYIDCCIIVWQSTSLVTTYSCILYKNFLPQISSRLSHAMTSFECSFRVHSKKECGVSAHYKHQTALLPLKTSFWSFERMLHNQIRRCWGGMATLLV